jgi:hypothetical protein
VGKHKGPQTGSTGLASSAATLVVAGRHQRLQLVPRMEREGKAEGDLLICRLAQQEPKEQKTHPNPARIGKWCYQSFPNSPILLPPPLPNPILYLGRPCALVKLME